MQVDYSFTTSHGQLYSYIFNWRYFLRLRRHELEVCSSKPNATSFQPSGLSSGP